MSKGKLNYKIVFSPDEEKNVGMIRTYKDDYIHVKIRSFGDKAEVLSGFENKLNFIVTFLFDSYLKSIFGDLKVDFITKSQLNNFLESFKQTDEFSKLLDTLNLWMKSINRIKGIKFVFNNSSYRFKHIQDLDATKSFTLTDFENYFRVLNIPSFLLDDRYSIEISKKIKVNNNKFLNKHYTNSDYDERFSSLW